MEELITVDWSAFNWAKGKEYGGRVEGMVVFVLPHPDPDRPESYWVIRNDAIVGTVSRKVAGQWAAVTHRGVDSRGLDALEYDTSHRPVAGPRVPRDRSLEGRRGVGGGGRRQSRT